LARKPRFEVVGLPQHIIQRGNNRQPCFRDDEDRRRYLADLEEALHAHDVELHAWVLMSNHVHLLATPRTSRGISRMMQKLGSRYVRWFNDRHERSGTLWDGRFRASLVETDSYLLACMRYIELNPVRANMVQHPGEHRWSSFAANALGWPDPLIVPHPTYLALRATVNQRCAVYRRLCSQALDEGMLADIRDALASELVLGSEEFKTLVESATARPARRRRGGRPPREPEAGDSETGV
jgi:putative transposase